ncbi:hypothetical protein LIPSTDRAFT_135251 [Lipomyces starkeyi NRRL Y-11557]|uniref:Uncharacterized protein n=1 Tax=Lipomyces starkeyi NRRL Y-11557 TaxID=675824 RepID=A0A1E3QFX1_LIPST|nr:hypothetical protein LIPSTDRAFT_135251 [Lipomyces starkeyi NRRL Y-11557]
MLPCRSVKMSRPAIPLCFLTHYFVCQSLCLQGDVYCVYLHVKQFFCHWIANRSITKSPHCKIHIILLYQNMTASSHEISAITVRFQQYSQMPQAKLNLLV